MRSKFCVTDCELGRPRSLLSSVVVNKSEPTSLATTSRAEVKMTEITAPEFTALDETVKMLRGSLDQMFLLVLGCCIFCEYQLSLKLHFTSLMSCETTTRLIISSNSRSSVTNKTRLI